MVFLHGGRNWLDYKVRRQIICRNITQLLSCILMSWLHIRYEASGVLAFIVFLLESIDEPMNTCHRLSGVMVFMWKGLIQIYMYEQAHLETHYSCGMSLHAKSKWQISPSMPFSNPQHFLDVLIKFVYKFIDPHKIIPWGELLVKSGSHVCAWPLIIPHVYKVSLLCVCVFINYLLLTSITSWMYTYKPFETWDTLGWKKFVVRITFFFGGVYYTFTSLSKTIPPCIFVLC